MDDLAIRQIKSTPWQRLTNAVKPMEVTRIFSRMRVIILRWARISGFKNIRHYSFVLSDCSIFSLSCVLTVELHDHLLVFSMISLLHILGKCAPSATIGLPYLAYVYCTSYHCRAFSLFHH